MSLRNLQYDSVIFENFVVVVNLFKYQTTLIYKSLNIYLI